jgi:hypothetical protein
MTGIIGKIASRSKIVNEPLTDGGVLLGSGADAITATAALANSEMLVGDGTTDPAIESGATLRTSIGVGTGDAVTFSAITGTTLDTGQGANELYDMDQNVKTDSAVTFTTVNTGQGANELYDMNQNVLTTSGVTHDKLTATTGVLFGSDTAAANTLDDYEEGTFTPAFSGSGSGTDTISYHNQIGKYTKIGNFVFIWIYCRINILYSIKADNVRIIGLPFDTNGGQGTGSMRNINFDSDTVQVEYNLETTAIRMQQIKDDAPKVQIPTSSLKNDVIVSMSAIYNV